MGKGEIRAALNVQEQKLEFPIQRRDREGSEPVRAMTRETRSTRMKAQPLVCRADEQKRDGWDDPVKGRVGWRTLFSGDLTPTDKLTAGVAELEPGGWLGLHRHTPPEIYYILEGSGVVTLEGREQEVRGGAAVFIPGDAEHGIRNTGDGPLRFVYVFPADSFAEIEYRFSKA
jgi:quercetin dioxygenase-like cupin family protein